VSVKVILQADVAGLGEEGEVKDVAGGYARNYLLPRKLVVPATKGNLKLLEQQREQIERKQEQHRAESRAVAERMAALPLQFEVRVGEQGRLYGSVTAQDIAARLKEAGIEIDRRLIELREPLRTLGEFDVPVRVAHAVTAHLKVTLHDQNAPVVPAADEAATAETEAAEPAEGEANDTEASTLTTPAE
jgi:large subunit ribosomal protein L9